MDLFQIIYACISGAGLVGNFVLGFKLFCGPGAKTRSPLLYGLVVSDLLVCCISGPTSLVIKAYPNLPPMWYNIAVFFQAWPVAASTLSMMAISIDRYLTVRNYRPARYVGQRRNQLTVVIFLIWFSAAVLSSLIIIPIPWNRSIMIARVFVIHVIPECAVLISHLGVHAKLTTLSLTARAKRGELPLPMPLLRKPTHVIIVAGLTKHSRDTLGPPESVEDISQPPTSTLRSRRRLAHALLWVAIIFILFWLPHVCCVFYKELIDAVSKEFEEYCLSIGHFHSALSPFVYWMINFPSPKLCGIFKLRTRFHRSASSTNEAALGPFNPMLIPQRHNRRQSPNL